MGSSRRMLMVIAWVLTVVLAVPYEPFAEASGHRYGRIVIMGNLYTPDRVILEGFVPLRPGQKIVADDVRTARLKLRASGLFTSTAVELVPNEFDSAFADLRVGVGDRVVNWYVFSLPFETLWVASRLPEALAESIGMGTRELLSIVEKLSRATPGKSHAP
jgi:hypothetical protein